MRLFPRQPDSDMPASGPGRSRRGMTLVELLIVVTILTTLVAAVIPILTPSTNQRRIREAARGLNTFIYSQQSTAISGRKLVGIGLKRLSLDTGRPEDRGVCLEVFAVEQPEPYCGFDANSAARVAANNSAVAPLRIDFVTRQNDISPNTDRLPVGWDPDIFPAGVIRPGDVIELNGNRYRIVAPLRHLDLLPSGFFGLYDGSARSASVAVVPLNATGQAVVPYHDENGNRVTTAGLQAVATGQGTPNEPPYWSQPARYKIHRQPVATSARPYQLPDGTAIDLQGSGMMDDAPLYLDSDVRQNLPTEVLNRTGLRDNNDPIYIMFTPEGTVREVHNAGGINGLPIKPTSNLSLLVGRRELIPASTTVNLANPVDAELEAAKAQVNWLNLESAWVTIGTQTGSIITTEMNNIQPARLRQIQANGPYPLAIRQQQLLEAREFARESSRAGGN